MLDEDLAVKVVDLVLNAHRQQSVGFQSEWCALRVEGAHRDPLATHDFLVDPGHRQAALFADLLAAGLVDDLALTVSPRLVGGDPLRIVAPGGALAGRADLRHVLEEDGSLMTLWRLSR